MIQVKQEKFNEENCLSWFACLCKTFQSFAQEINCLQRHVTISTHNKRPPERSDWQSVECHCRRCICTFPCEHDSLLLCWVYAPTLMSPPMLHSRLSSRPRAPTRLTAAEIHLRHIVILDVHLHGRQQIWAYPNRVLRLGIWDVYANAWGWSEIYLLAIDGGISISFEKVPLTFTFQRLMPGMPWLPSFPDLPGRPLGPVNPIHEQTRIDRNNQVKFVLVQCQCAISTGKSIILTIIKQFSRESIFNLRNNNKLLMTFMVKLLRRYSRGAENAFHNSICMQRTFL